MTKRIERVLLLTILLILVGLLSLLIFHRKISIEEANKLWEIYDQNLEATQKNMNSIAISKDGFIWGEMKNSKIEDIEYQNALNTFLKEMSEWYYFYTTKEETVLNFSIRRYRNKKTITKKQLQEFNQNDDVIIDLTLLNSVYASKNRKTPERFQEKLTEIEEILNTELFTKKNATYEELVFRKVTESSILKNISEWLTAEYYRIK